MAVLHDRYTINRNIDSVDAANLPYELWAFLRNRAIDGQPVHVERSVTSHDGILIHWQDAPEPFTPHMTAGQFALALATYRDRQAGKVGN